MTHQNASKLTVIKLSNDQFAVLKNDSKGALLITLPELVWAITAGEMNGSMRTCNFDYGEDYKFRFHGSLEHLFVTIFSSPIGRPITLEAIE